MRCEVLRPFQATNDAALEMGQIVDTDGWREESVFRLIAQRYLRQVPDVESPSLLEDSTAPAVSGMDDLGRFHLQRRKRH